MSKSDNENMRTTIRMNEELARRAKRYAARHRRTFTEVVEQAVAELLAKESSGTRAATAAAPLRLPVVGDPAQRISEEDYRRMIEEMYDEEIREIMRDGTGRDP
jgi:hypothetical protein